MGCDCVNLILDNVIYLDICFRFLLRRGGSVKFGEITATCGRIVLRRDGIFWKVVVVLSLVFLRFWIIRVVFLILC